MENNEILKLILEEMQGLKQAQTETNRRLDSMDGRLDSMDGRLDSMDGRLGTLEGDVAAIKKDVVKIYEIEKKVDVLGEQMQGVQERFVQQDRIESKLDALKIQVDSIEHVVAGHTKEIQDLHLVK